MKAAGIEPAEIDTVVITHAHPVHVGGTLDDEGKPVYANARYFISKDEWKFWTSEIAMAKAPVRHVAIARKYLGAVQDRLSLLSHEFEILPGIDAIPAPGHTPGHMVVRVSSGGEQLLYISDTALHPLHLEHPDWTPIYDIIPEKAAASRRRILDRAAEEKVLVIGQHFPPFPSLGYVVKKGEGWLWRSLR
jgi:glyoxylase-like metal-dependent hydrolase (beta-lactamase superfamily II)